MDKEKKKILRRIAGWIGLRLTTNFSSYLPLSSLYRFGELSGKLLFLLGRAHRKIALDSLAIAYPYLSFEERRNIAMQSFIFMAQSSLELLYFLRNTRELDKIKIEGIEFLDRALEFKKGVIALTAHLGNFPLMSLKLAQVGYPVNIIVRPMRDRKTGDYINRLRTQAGVKTIFSYPRKEVVAKTIRTLRNNEIVVIQMDQNFGTGGVWVKFFNKLAATPVGPIVFALRTNATILPIRIIRKEQGVHLIKIEPPYQLIITDNKDETILLNAVRLTNIIEGWVKEHPAQWGWIHRRWKSRPSKEVLSQPFRVQKDAVFV